MNKHVLIQFCQRIWLAMLLLGLLSPNAQAEHHRSPVAIAMAADESWLVSANRTSNSITLIELPSGKILHELTVGNLPNYVARVPNQSRLLVSLTEDRQVAVVDVKDNRLHLVGKIEVKFDPWGIICSPDGKHAYVALNSSAQVAKIDLSQQTVVSNFEVGRWPRYLAINQAGSRLIVGQSGDGNVGIYDTMTESLLFDVNFKGMNLGHMKVSADDQYVYFPWLHYGDNIPSPGNIRRGWVLGNRLGKVRITEEEPDGVTSLDTRGNAVSDAWAVDLTPDESHILVSASGTHELLVLKNSEVKFHQVGSTEHIDQHLLQAEDRFFRIPLGGRPLGIKASQDNQTVYVANYFLDSIQVVDLKERKVVKQIDLGGPSEPSLARQGEAIFYDGDRSFDRWYSCHSCHFEGGTNSQIIDTLNDGSAISYKTVLPLWHLSDTSPWTWHGWQQDPRDAMQKSFTKTMQGKAASEEDIDAILAYFNQLTPPKSPFLESQGKLSPAAQRGQKVFHSEVAGCASCHSGPLFTDGEIHDVGLGSRRDRYTGYNTPTLLGLHSKVRFLHHGRARTLEEVLTKYHDPEQVTGNGKLTNQQVQDLIAYLKTL